jgi:hypothetical protein
MISHEDSAVPQGADGGKSRGDQQCLEKLGSDKLDSCPTPLVCVSRHARIDVLALSARGSFVEDTAIILVLATLAATAGPAFARRGTGWGDWVAVGRETRSWKGA